MKTAQLTGIRQFSLRDVPLPLVARPDDVLIQMKAVGVCGSDVHYYTEGKIGDQIVRFPFTIGHEGAGVAVKTGGGTVRVKPGDRIAIDPAVYCGACDQCLAGRENTCRNLVFLGCPGQREGCLSEYIVLPEKCCFPIPSSMSFERAVLSEPFAIALYAVERAMVPKGARAAVLGAGPIGMSVLAALRQTQAGPVYMTDLVEERLTLARSLGAAWCGNARTVDPVAEISRREPLLLDAVFECCGKTEALRQAIDLLKPGGTLAIVGIPSEDESPLPLHALRRKEITVKNIRRQNRCTQKALDLLGSGAVNLDALVTHHFSLSRIAEAFDLVSGYRDGALKAIVDFPG
jgi:L-iditol 2-dehydrogenase